MELSYMAKQGALDKMFDSSFEQWTQSALFMDAFTSSPLTFSRFTRPVGQFFKTRMYEYANA